MKNENNNEASLNLTSDSTTEIKECLLTYGEDTLLTKFPHYIDGLKDVSRRILWFTRDQKEPRSFLRVMGDIVENHVSGDSSVYGAIIRLGQRFMVGHPLIHIEGKSGSYHSPSDSAAPRYLNMAISEFSRDVFFNGIHLKTIPMMPTKNFGSMEPRYLIPKLPTALILGNLTVGFGFKSTIPMIDFEDVCNLVMLFAEHYQKKNVGIPDARKLASLLIPTFPIVNIIKNRDALLAAYRKGDYTHPVSLEGLAEINGSSITLRSVPYGVDFGTTTQRLREMMKDRKHWLWQYITSANQYSSSEAEFTMEVKRGLNPFEVLKKLKSILRFQYSWAPLYSYMKDGRAVSLDPAILTYLWYQERSISIAGGLKYRQADLVYKKMTLEAILQICEHSDLVINIIKRSETEEEAIKALYTKFTSLTWKQAKIITQQRLATLAKANRKQIEQDIEQTNSDMESIHSQFSRIDETIYQDAQFLKKKYKSTRCSRFSTEYKGCVQFGTSGCTHFFDTVELQELLNSRGWSDKHIYFFDGSTTRSFIVNGKLVIPEEYSKDMDCSQVIIHPKDSGRKLIIQEYERPLYMHKDSQFPKEFNYLWLKESFKALRRNGQVTDATWKDIEQRKAMRLSKTDIIHGFDASISQPVIIHMNSHDTNTLRIDWVEHDKITTVALGTEYVLAVLDASEDECFLHIPSVCTKNTAMMFLQLKNLTALYASKKHVLFNLNKSITIGKLTRDPIVRSKYTLVFRRA